MCSTRVDRIRKCLVNRVRARAFSAFHIDNSDKYHSAVFAPRARYGAVAENWYMRACSVVQVHHLGRGYKSTLYACDAGYLLYYLCCVCVCVWLRCFRDNRLAEKRVAIN